jgi:uncharacterized membrane protein YkvA (DUF1232 family)
MGKRLRRLWGLANRRRLAVHLVALYKLLRHPQTPRASKIVALLVLAYALSPIDLIPDFIPILGQLDDLIIVPLGITLAVKMTPPALWQAQLKEAEAHAGHLPRLLWPVIGVVLLILLLWSALLGGFVWLLAGAFADT